VLGGTDCLSNRRDICKIDVSLNHEARNTLPKIAKTTASGCWRVTRKIDRNTRFRERREQGMCQRAQTVEGSQLLPFVGS